LPRQTAITIHIQLKHSPNTNKGHYSKPRNGMSRNKIKVYKQSTAYSHLITPTPDSYQHPLTTNQHGRMSIQHTQSMQPMQQKEPTPLYISRKGQRLPLQPRQLPHSLHKLGNSAFQPVGFGPRRTSTNDTSSGVHPSRTRDHLLVS
jgi:hypothetical protein